MKKILYIIVPLISFLLIFYILIDVPKIDVYFADDFVKYLNEMMLDEKIVFDLEQFNSNSLQLSTISSVSENQKEYLPAVINEALNAFVPKKLLSDEMALSVNFFEDNTSIKCKLIKKININGIEVFRYEDVFNE